MEASSPRGGGAAEEDEDEDESDNSMYHNFTLKDKVLKEMLKTTDDKQNAHHATAGGKPPQQPIMTSKRRKKLLLEAAQKNQGNRSPLNDEGGNTSEMLITEGSHNAGINATTGAPLMSPTTKKQRLASAFKNNAASMGKPLKSSGRRASDNGLDNNSSRRGNTPQIQTPGPSYNQSESSVNRFRVRTQHGKLNHQRNRSNNNNQNNSSTLEAS